MFECRGHRPRLQKTSPDKSSSGSPCSRLRRGRRSERFALPVRSAFSAGVTAPGYSLGESPTGTACSRPR